MRLQNKVAMVIGASRGSGKQIALELAREGADVVVAARTERPGQTNLSGSISQTAKEIEAIGRRALPVKVDLAIGREIDALFEQAVAAFGGIDILVHSVQYMGPGYRTPFLETAVDDWEAQLKVNLLSAMHATKLATPIMSARGGGKVILISSAAAWKNNANLPGDGSTGVAYPVTKAGLNRFVSFVTKELVPHNVSIVAVDPGFTLAEHVTETAVDGAYHGWDLKEAHGMEVPAQAVRYLCASADLKALSGQAIVAKELVAERGLLPA